VQHARRAVLAQQRHPVAGALAADRRGVGILHHQRSDFIVHDHQFLYRHSPAIAGVAAIAASLRTAEGGLRLCALESDPRQFGFAGLVGLAAIKAELADQALREHGENRG
jgi:hypothetical protein